MTIVRNRIVHITTVHHPFDPRIYYKQLASLQDAGFDTHLIAPHDRSEQAQGITLHALPPPDTRRQRLALHRQAFESAQNLNAILYQIHDPELLPVLFILKKTTGAQAVYDMHENYRAKGPLLGRMLRGLEHWAFRWLDHVLVAEESYRSIVDDSSSSYSYIPNYVRPLGRTDSEQVPPIPKTPTRLLYTGTISTSRGLRTMVDLAAHIQRRDRPETLNLVGICRYENQRSRTEARIQDEGLHGIIERIGWDTYVPPCAMPPHYRCADVGLALCEPHPNLVDSILTKFYEYLYYGLPIICSDFPRWKHFVKRHACGAVVPPGEPEAVLDVLDTWQTHPQRYRQHAENARAAASNYRWKPVGNRLVDRCHNLISATPLSRVERP